MSVQINDNTSYVKNDMESGVGLAIRLMLEDIHQLANPNTPMKTGDLRARVRKQMDANKGTITWESSYAEVQEKGYRNSQNGRVYFHNYTTPGTGPQYAANSVAKVIADLPEYLERVGLS